ACPDGEVVQDTIHPLPSFSPRRATAMVRGALTFVVAVLSALLVVSALTAQVRVTPKEAKGVAPQGEPWAEVPELFKHLKIPEWPLPTDLKRWQEIDRAKTRETLLRCLGEMPPRPDPSTVRILSKEDRGDYTLERFEFHNGVDMIVPGILLIPKQRKGPASAVIALHGHGSSKESVCTNPKNSQFVGPGLAKRGYVVAAIDGYFASGRVG